MSNSKKQPQRAKLGLKRSFVIFYRLLRRIYAYSPVLFFLAIFTIIVSSAANVIGSLFTGTILVDEIITPMLSGETPIVFGAQTSLPVAIGVMAGIYGIGIISTYVY